MESESDLRRLRAEIDEIDTALVQLIAKRRDVAVEIAKIKQSTSPKDDENRLDEVLENVQKIAEEQGLDSERIKEIWKSLIAYMITEQMRKYPY